MWQVKVNDVMTDNVRGNDVDIVAMVNGLIGIAAETGELTCEYAKSATEPTSLRFASGSEQLTVMTASTLLRAICARLAVVASGTSGLKLCPYGDNAEFSWSTDDGHPVQLRLVFENHKRRWFKLSRSRSSSDQKGIGGSYDN
jgi:hypothetical protein